MEKEYDVIILGAGPAGCTAGIYCSTAGLKTLVLDKLGPGGQMTEAHRIENYPGFPEGIDGFTLGQKMKDGILKSGGAYETIHINKISLSGSQKHLESSNAHYFAKAVILATGASPLSLIHI